MAGRLFILLLPLLCGCSLMIPPGYGEGDADTDATETTGDGSGDVPSDVEEEEVPGDCIPDERRCHGERWDECNDSGAGWDLIELCDSGTVCVEGSGCVPSTPCSRAASEHRHYGCEFWTVPLPIDSLPGVGTWELGLILANVSDTDMVTFTIMQGTTPIREDEDIHPDSAIHIGLPFIAGQSDGLPANIWGSRSVSTGAYYILTDNPVTAYQFNPRVFESGGELSGHSSSTLLLPEHSLRSSYHVLAVPPHSMDVAIAGDYQKRASYISIVGTSDTTTIDVTAGGTIAEGSGIAHTEEGGEIHTTIGTGEVLTLASGVPENCTRSIPGAVEADDNLYCEEAELDLSGTTIDASQPVAVFVGAVAVNVPFDVGTTDHIAEQLPPLETLGRFFVTGPMSASGEADVHTVVKLMAVSNATRVEFHPTTDGYDEVTLQQGDTLEVTLTDSVVITSIRPLLAAQFIVGREYGSSGSRPIGDPAMLWLVPERQWTESFVFEIPQEYGEGSCEAYVHVVSRTGAIVSFDGTELEFGDWSPVGSSSVYQIAWEYIDSGIHFIESDVPIGVQLWGMAPEAGMAHPVGTRLLLPE
jgi:hypothetical protein